MKKVSLYVLGISLVQGLIAFQASAYEFRVPSNRIVQSAIVASTANQLRSDVRSAVLSIAWMDGRSVRKMEYHCSSPEECTQLKNLIAEARKQNTDVILQSDSDALGAKITGITRDYTDKEKKEMADKAEAQRIQLEAAIVLEEQLAQVKKQEEERVAIEQLRMSVKGSYKGPLTCWTEDLASLEKHINEKVKILNQVWKPELVAKVSEEKLEELRKELGVSSGPGLRFNKEAYFPVSSGTGRRDRIVFSDETVMYPRGVNQANTPALVPQGQKITISEVSNLGSMMRIVLSDGSFVDVVGQTAGELFNNLYKNGIQMAGILDSAIDCAAPEVLAGMNALKGVEMAGGGDNDERRKQDDASESRKESGGGGDRSKQKENAEKARKTS
jgi:DNA-binding Lrp family transcriptional regulator